MSCDRFSRTSCGIVWKWSIPASEIAWHCRHNDRGSVSNHQPHGCLLNRLFRRRSKKTSKLRVTGLCAGNSSGTGEFPAQMASYAENVSIWRHHGPVQFYKKQLPTNIQIVIILCSKCKGMDWWLTSRIDVMFCWCLLLEKCKTFTTAITHSLIQIDQFGWQYHDDVIKWKYFPRHWPVVRGIHRSRWFPRTKASDAELWCSLWSAPE